MILIGAVGVCLGIVGVCVYYQYKSGGWQKLAQDIIQRAESESHKIKLELDFQLKQKELEHARSLEKLTEQKMHKLQAREEKLDRQLALFEKKLQEAEKREKESARVHKRLEESQAELELKSKECHEKLQLLAGISTVDAKQMLFDEIAHEIQAECSHFLHIKRKEAEASAHLHATSILATAINRLAVPTVSEVALITIALPNHEMKGRLIGREGRNIRVLERACGVNFVIDDTPNAIVISGFDPIRKEIARIAVKELIQDGRIHPTRIEEVVAAAELKVLSQMKEWGEDAALKSGALQFHPELIQYLGKLHFLYSSGQNVLSHSLEVSQLMGVMASELQLNCGLAKRIGLLHDIGKAISHEMEGSHAIIGQQLALKYGESEEVANGIGCHHEEIAPLTFEASLCTAADLISRERLGARAEALEQYIKRSTKLEQLCKQFVGVEKAYAMHAAKELRVFVEPSCFDDAKTLYLAREIAKKIEKELSYPGKIKVTVIREKKTIEYAS